MSPKGPASQILLARLTAELEGLKRAFARYVDGHERAAPMAEWSAFRQRLAAAQAQIGSQTATHFRYATLAATVLTYETLWNRQLGQIEAGTLPAHRQRALARAAQSVPTASSTSPAPSTVPTDQAAAQPSRAGEVLRQLHQTFAAAAQQAGQVAPSLAALAEQLAQQVAEVRRRSGQHAVNIGVVVDAHGPRLEVTVKDPHKS